MEDDLDEAEFYAGQGMYAEAIDVLNGLHDRFPGHRLVLAKLREVEALAAGEGGLDASGSTDALDLDQIEEMGVEHLVELDADSQPVNIPRKRQPTVMLEKPLDDGDSDTHYDLGLAYKEMALHDDAIKSFEKVLRVPGREVQCRVMIGMCLREQGNPSEAIHQFKQGLHADPSERERQSLYYEIGITYEVIGDDAEALYYFEIVLKRDPNFADAAVRAASLRAHGGRPVHSSDDDI
jgi:tetratricopeptide (TPR) repeat protein